MSQHDLHYMQRALALAARGQYTTAPNPNVGCVLVRDGQVVGEGWHQRAGEPHAEVHALRAAGDAARGATAYVTLEPCSHYGRTPPCALALIEAGVRRVVVAMQDPNPLVAGRGLTLLREAGIEVACGVGEAEAGALNPGFIKRMRAGMPWVRVKQAATLDGRTALADGRSQWITGDEARADVMRWRARSGVILAGADTVLADDPALNVRWQALPAAVQADYALTDVRQPVRVIVDSRNRIEASARLFSCPGPVWMARAGNKPAWPAGLEELLVPTVPSGKLDLRLLLQALAARGVNEVWVEGGRQLSAALLAAGLVDEWFLYLAPKVLGDRAQGLLGLAAPDHLPAQAQFAWQEMTRIGADLRLILRPLAALEE